MTAAPFRVRGWHVLASMLVFFGAIIAVNVAFAVIAVRSFPGEDVRRSYLQGIHYNDTLAQRRAETAVGWTAVAALAERDGAPVLEISIQAPDGEPIRGATITGVLQRPATAREDRDLSFVEVGDGRYEAEPGALATGQWRLRAQAQRNESTRTFESVLIWRS
ncbi:MAG: FixH family protein [Hyphomonadaceae bacterium]|nr:FixH family protein [Hyphomonadaceae bacterium]